MNTGGLGEMPEDFEMHEHTHNGPIPTDLCAIHAIQAKGAQRIVRGGTMNAVHADSVQNEPKDAKRCTVM